MAEPTTRRPGSLGRGQSENVSANQGDGRSARSAWTSKGARSAGRIGQPNRAEGTPVPSTLGPKSDVVTASAVALQRRCYGATVGAAMRALRRNRSNSLSAGAVETGNRIADETADSLGSAVLVGACGVFVPLLRNHAKIVRAHVNRESPQPAARPFSVGSHSFRRCCHVLPLCREDGARKSVLKG